MGYKTICYYQQVPTKIFTWHILHVSTKFEGYYFPCPHEETKSFSSRPIERRLYWGFYKTEMKIWAVGCGLGWTVLKKVWADYEQLLRVGFSTFCGQKKKKKTFLKTL